MVKEENRIRIGNQTAFSASTIVEPFHYAVDNGFDAFEWFPDKRETGEGWATCDIGARTRDMIKRISRDHDMALSVHVPWRINPLDENALDDVFEHVDFSEDLGACLLNIHLHTEKGVDAYLERIRPLISALSDSKTQLAIENTPLTSPDDFNQLFRRLRRLASEDGSVVGMCFDLGHANLHRPTRNNYLEFMDMLDPEVPIIHVHLHENYGDTDSHLPVFSGPSATDDSGIRNVLDRLKKLGFAGSIILEQWPQPPTLLNQARDRLFEILKY